MSSSAPADGIAAPLPPTTVSSPPGRHPTGGRVRYLAVGIPMLAGLVHVLVVARRYHVGSFDDDASYILTAKVLLAGGGFTAHLPSGAVAVGAYPPGYSLLLVPLLWIGHGYLGPRALSVVCYAATFPLTWSYLGRRRLPDGVRVGVLVMLAFSPVLATFAGMVMAEAPFVVLFLVVLLLLERWERSERILAAEGIGLVVAAAGLIWLKEAAVAMVAGAVVWLLMQRQARKALALMAGSLILLLPIAMARLASRVPLAGSRYSKELGGYYSTSVGDRVSHVVHGFAHWFSTALPATVVPRGDPLPATGVVATALQVLSWHVALLCIVGLVVWTRRHRDAAVVVVPLYVAETLLWPNVNERRVVLALPIVLGWYVLGGWTVSRFVLDRPPPGRHGWLGLRPITLSVMAALVIAVPLAEQLPRNYLFGLHQHSSEPQGSRYAAILAKLGSPGDVVETDYESTVALYTGHRTANGAFVASLAACSEQATEASLSQDHAGYLLIGAVNKPELIDSPCLLGQASSGPWAVRVLRTGRDLASVFELVGPGTGHPGLVDVTAQATLSASGPLTLVPIPALGYGDNPGTTPATLATAGTGVLTWAWNRPVAIEQVSVGAAGADAGATGGVSVELRTPSGSWVVTAATDGAVGDSRGAGAVGDGKTNAAYLLASPNPAIRATGLRVIIHGSGQVSAMDVHALAVDGGR